METTLLEQVEDTAPLLVRFGPCTARPISPQQPEWQGETPAGVKNILTRSALRPGYRDHYAKWASNFALLDDAYLEEIFGRAPGTLSELKLHPWQTLPWVNSHYCNVRGDYLWVQQQLQGCTIELCYPGEDPKRASLRLRACLFCARTPTPSRPPALRSPAIRMQLSR